MAMNRKGIFFTIMALLIIGFLLTTEKVTTTPLTVNLADTLAAQSRVTVMNAYAETFETQASNSLATAGYFTLQNLSKVVGRDGYLTNMNTTIDDCIRVQPQNCLNESVRVNTTMKTLIDLAQSNLSIDTQYHIEKIWVTEEVPFEVVFWMNISYNISDPFANWTFTNRTVRADVHVNGIQDPAYARANTSGWLSLNAPRTFKASQYKRAQFNNTTFYDYYVRMEYIANEGPNTTTYDYAPSVLQRYTGNLTNGSICCGIESVVRWEEISNVNRTAPAIVNTSFVDYLFFSPVRFNCTDTTTSGISKLNSSVMPGNSHKVRIDNNHLLSTYLNMSRHREASCTP